jgi:crotonobetainyl-CoA:carnitine CoA-transferase CaiB-like acyl-CoA transferase
VPQVALPLRFSASPPVYDRPPPLLGEHTASLLRERLGLDEERIAELAAAGVIGVRE